MQTDQPRDTGTSDLGQQQQQRQLQPANSTTAPLTQQRLGLRGLADAAHEQVDVVDVRVDELEPGHQLGGDEVLQRGEAVHAAQPAHLAVRVVAGQPVVPAPLDVERHQVHPELVRLAWEQ